MTGQQLSLKEKLEVWLKKSGYPLEMTVASVVRAAGFSTFQSEYYFDRESREMREIDVVGVLEVGLDAGEFRLSVAIECKSTPDKPWVVLSTTARSEGPDHITDRASSKAGEELLSRIAERLDVQQLPAFKRPERAGYSIVRALGDGRDVPYAAMMNVAKAAGGIAWEASGSDRTTVAEIVLPVVVVDGALFEYYLGEEGEAILAEIQRASVYWRNPIAGRIHSVITVTTVEGLPGLLEEAEQTFESLTLMCESELRDAMKAVAAKSGKAKTHLLSNLKADF